MRISNRSLAVAIASSLLILCSGCASQHGTAAVIPPGTGVINVNRMNTIPPGPSAATRTGAKRFAGEP